MKKALVMIQSGQFSVDQQTELETVIRTAYREHVSPETLTVIWSAVGTGKFFTNDAPAQTSIVSAECDNGFPQAQRVAYLKA